MCLVICAVPEYFYILTYLFVPLLRLGAVDVFARSGLVQQGGCLVLVEDAGLLLPDVEVFFADGEQHGDVLGLDDMALAST